jgi:hypothetical protein
MRVLSAQRERGRGRHNTVDSLVLLDEITSPLKEDVLSQLMARRDDYLHHTGQDRSTLYRDVLSGFNDRWADLDTRIPLVPGKEVLRLFSSASPGTLWRDTY